MLIFRRVVGWRARARQSQEDYLALMRAGVRVGLDGRRVAAPPGVVDADGFANLVKGVKKRA
jgi:hypothetical protein